MDPNKTLNNARIALLNLRHNEYLDYEAAENLADAFESLDRWMSKGGFKPNAWKTLNEK